MIEFDDKYVEYSVSTITSTLLGRAKTGEDEAWFCVVYLYGPLVYKWCRKRGLPQDAARDASQDVFEVVARKLQEFRRADPQDTFRGWLRTITNHKITDYWRARYTQPAPVSIDDRQLLEQARVGMDADEDSPAQDSLDIFERVLQYGKERVNPIHWEIFWRVIVDEENRQDVATSYDMKRANIDLIVSRVLAQLRETFGDTFEDRDGPFPKSRKDSDGSDSERVE